MILKNFEINKIDIRKQKYFLFYGDNNALIEKTISDFFTNKFKEKIYNYEETEILNNKANFFNQILNSSFFENEKLIVISRVSEKILEILKEIIDKNIEDTIIILKADQLEKKSKLRKFYEENKRTVCMAFYPDTEMTLRKLVVNFFRNKKINISQENINFILDRCNNNRQYINNELKKIELLTLNRKNPITMEEIIKIIHLNENHSIYELIDHCLLKNKKKTVHILNENNFGTEDTIIIVRTFLSKLKKILKLANEYTINQNIDLTIKNAKPPIFWKDKDNVKKQLNYWSAQNIKKLIFELNQIEIKVKKYSSNNINILTDFIISKSGEQANN